MNELEPTAEKHIAIVYDWPPYPIRSGDNRRVAEMIQVMRGQGWKVHLVMTRMLDRETANIQREQVDYFHMYLPGSLNRSLFQKGIKFFDRITATIGIPPLRDIAGRLLGKNRKLLVQAVSNLPTYPQGLDTFLAKLAAAHSWDAVIIHFLWLHPAIRLLPDHVTTLLDTIDLQHTRDKEYENAGLSYENAMSKEKEAAILNRFDAVIAIQQEEARIIREMCPKKATLMVGTSTLPDNMLASDPLPAQFFYVGGSNPMNIEGLEHFFNEIWPKAYAQNPDIRFRVCGYVYQAFIGRDLPGVEFLQHVEDIEPQYSQATAILNPIWGGTGLKIKSVEAIARGKVLITTPKGVEGMQGDPRAACRCCETDEAFVEALLDVVSQPEERTRLEQAASHYRNETLTIEKVYQELIDYLNRISHG